MNPAQSIKKCLTKATFSGTACRSEFWWFYLFGWLLIFPAAIADGFISATLTNLNLAPYDPDNPPFTLFYNIIQLMIVFPTIAVACRRLHDMGKSGWWQLIALTIIGIIPLLFWLTRATKRGNNQFGGMEVESHLRL